MPAAFSVGNGGHIMFEVNGESQSYKDYKEPMLKDYKTMNSLLSTTNSIYSAGQRLDGTKLQLIGAQVENMLANPNTIKSILAGDFKGAGIDLSGIAYNPEDVAGTRVQVKDAIVSALESVANEGYAEKERKRAERNNSNSKVADPSKTDKIYSQIDTEAKNGTYNLIPVTQNQQLVWSPEQNAYISMVRSSQSSLWKAETNADGNTVGYAPKS